MRAIPVGLDTQTHDVGREPAPTQPVLSVVVPTHNVAPWIEETLDSILAQDIASMEVLVVDDHSTDKTMDLLQDYASNDSRIRVIPAEARGGGSARNLGVKHARGKYLIFADGDDIIPDGGYRSLVESLERSGSDIVFGDFIKFRPVDTWRPTRSMQALKTPVRGTTLGEAPTLIYNRACWNKAFNREWFMANRIEFPDVPRSNDILPMTEAYIRASSIDVVEEVVYVYRERSGRSSMTAKADSSRSVISYLTQELACAKLIVAANNSTLLSTYSSLIYDRDTYVHIANFVGQEVPQGGEAAEASRLLNELLGQLPEPSLGVNHVKVLVLQLVARGAYAAADALARYRQSERIGGSVAAGELAHALDSIDAAGLFATKHGNRLRQELHSTIPLHPVLGPASDWQCLADSFATIFGASLFGRDPWGPKDVSGAVEVTRRAQARVTGLRSGRSDLKVSGTSQRPSGEYSPVLLGFRHGARKLVMPESVDWQAKAGSWEWTANFSSSDLAFGVPFTPALADASGQHLSAIPCEIYGPEYDPKDAFLYEYPRDRVVVRRRAHWAFRAARRALSMVKGRLTRLMR